MQIKRYSSCLKVSVSATDLIRAIHPTYSDEQIEYIKPHILKVLRTCKKYPFEFEGVFIKADSINSWYTLTGTKSSILAFVTLLVSNEVNK